MRKKKVSCEAEKRPQYCSDAPGRFKRKAVREFAHLVSGALELVEVLALF